MSSLHPSALPSAPCLEDAVEGRLGGPPELCEAALLDYVAERVFGGDSAEGGAAERQRVGRAAERGGRGEGSTDDVEVLLHGVAGHRLDDERAALSVQHFVGATGRADGVAHVVQAVEEADHGVTLTRYLARLRHLERDAVGDAGLFSRAARVLD